MTKFCVIVVDIILLVGCTQKPATPNGRYTTSRILVSGAYSGGYPFSISGDIRSVPS